MARAARAQMADMRAMEEQNYREQMHGGQFYGAGMVGAGATPSMGLSQFRGGASHKCPNCRRKRCMCEGSSSDEDMEGGAGLSSFFGAVGDAASGVVRGLRGLRGVRPTVVRPTSSAIVPYNPAQAAFTAHSGFRNYVLQNAFGRPGTTLATRPAGTMKPYSPAEAAARIRAAQAMGETNATVAQRLSRMGVTPARVAAALALGIPAIALAIYFGEVDGTDPGYYDPGAGGIPKIPDHGDPPYPEPPDGPGGPGGDGPYGPGGPGRRGRRATGEGVATGNLADEYYAAQRLGAGRRGGRSMQIKRRPANPRALIVRQVMSEQGLSLPAASKYVKDNGLY
jgi:hypothetical protein